jgi:hypothetical protein
VNSAEEISSECALRVPEAGRGTDPLAAMGDVIFELLADFRRSLTLQVVTQLGENLITAHHGLALLPRLRLCLIASRVRSPMASRSHCETVAMMFSTSLPAAEAGIERLGHRYQRHAAPPASCVCSH